MAPSVCEELLLNKYVLRPGKEHRRRPETLGRAFEPFAAESLYNRESIAGWYFPVDERANVVALLHPPNQGTKAEALPQAELLLALGCSVLLYDYQGFGDSGGLADVRTLLGDAEGVLAWAEAAGIVTPQTRLIAVGLSLGSLVAIGLAAHLPDRFAALVLEGAVEPLRALRRSFGPLGAAIAEVACAQVPAELRSETQIEQVRCPILFVHGQEDQVSVLGEAEYLASRAQNPTIWTAPGCGHLDIVATHKTHYLHRLREFLVSAEVL